MIWIHSEQVCFVVSLKNLVFFWVLCTVWVWYKCFTISKFFTYMSDTRCFSLPAWLHSVLALVCLLHSLGVLQLHSLYYYSYSTSISEWGCSYLFSDLNTVYKQYPDLQYPSLPSSPASKEEHLLCGAVEQQWCKSCAVKAVLPGETFCSYF